MELLEGRDLAQAIRENGPLPPGEVLHVVQGVAAALTEAHEKGIVHRDIKPANVFLCSGAPRPFVKLVDFGIAKRLEDLTLTSTNAFVDVSVRSSSRFAMPKSTSFTNGRGAPLHKKTFAGLMSRWTMPFSCASVSAAATPCTT